MLVEVCVGGDSSRGPESLDQPVTSRRVGRVERPGDDHGLCGDAHHLVQNGGAPVHGDVLQNIDGHNHIHALVFETQRGPVGRHEIRSVVPFQVCALVGRSLGEERGEPAPFRADLEDRVPGLNMTQCLEDHAEMLVSLILVEG